MSGFDIVTGLHVLGAERRACAIQRRSHDEPVPDGQTVQSMEIDRGEQIRLG